MPTAFEAVLYLFNFYISLLCSLLFPLGLVEWSGGFEEFGAARKDLVGKRTQFFLHVKEALIMRP